MVYRFKDLNDSELYKNHVIFVCGSYAIFNSMVIDRARESCSSKLDVDESVLKSLMSEFGDELLDNIQGLAFEEFMSYVKTPSIEGKWFCSVDFKTLTKKNKERLWAYIKKPSSNGLLVVNVLDFKDTITVRKNTVVTRSKVVGMIQLQYPTKNILKDIVEKQFRDRGVRIDEKSINYFILRLSDSYNDYTAEIDNMMVGLGNKKVLDYKTTKELLKNTANYMFDDFVLALTKPVSSVEIQRRRKIYKMLDSLMGTMSCKQIVEKLLRRIDNIIEFRTIINNGSVPLLVRYSAQEVKEVIGEDHKLSKINNVSFKKSIYLASRTTLKDWYFMKTILMNRKSIYSESDNLRAILAVIHRGVVSNDRLMNDIGIKNTLEEGLFELNAVHYPYMINAWRKEIFNKFNGEEK